LAKLTDLRENCVLRIGRLKWLRVVFNGFCISGVEPLGSATGEVVYLKVGS
jgi:hypothetical protein